MGKENKKNTTQKEQWNDLHKKWVIDNGPRLAIQEKISNQLQEIFSISSTLLRLKYGEILKENTSEESLRAILENLIRDLREYITKL